MYDAANQLAVEWRSGSNASVSSFTYDAVGSRSINEENGVRTTYTYDRAAQLQYSVAMDLRTSYTYDAAANLQLIQDSHNERTTIAWSFENQISSARLPTGGRSTYIYNADQRRVQYDVLDRAAHFVWDIETDSYLLEQDTTAGTQTLYTAEPVHFGRLISQRSTNTALYFVFDVLGSMRAAIASDSSVTDAVAYDAWGVITNRSGNTTLHMLWCGEVGYSYTTSEGIYVRARQYSPRSARWYSRDAYQALRFSAAYEYANNLPTLLIDPSGAVPVKCYYCAPPFWSQFLINNVFSVNADCPIPCDDCCRQVVASVPGQYAGCTPRATFPCALRKTRKLFQVPSAGRTSSGIGIQIVEHASFTADYCGAFEWAIYWQRKTPAPAGGVYIVQKIVYSVHVVDCAGNVKLHKNDTYWEAWQIDANERHTQIHLGTFVNAEGQTIKAGFDDIYQGPLTAESGPLECTIGKLNVRGVYWEAPGRIPTPPFFLPGGPTRAIQAGELYASYVDPGGPVGTRSQREHSIAVDWDCCG